LEIVQIRKVSKKQTLKIKAEVVNKKSHDIDLQYFKYLIKFNKKIFSKTVTKQIKELPIVHKTSDTTGVR